MYISKGRFQILCLFILGLLYIIYTQNGMINRISAKAKDEEAILLCAIDLNSKALARANASLESESESKK